MDPIKYTVHNVMNADKPNIMITIMTFYKLKLEKM